MSTEPIPSSIFGSDADPKAIEFIDALKEKTAAGRIEWREWEKGLAANLPNGVLVYFHCTTKAPYQWTLFVVQIEKEIIFQTRKSLPDSLMSLAAGALLGANDLFKIIVNRKGNPLDRALESIKGL